MTSFDHVSHITILMYTMIWLPDVQLTKGLAQATKGYSIFKNISSVKISGKPVNVVWK